MVAVEDTKICKQCKAAKPIAAFSPNKSKPRGYFDTCLACRMANGSGRRKTKTVASEETPPKPNPATCTHRRLCGDALILRRTPDFYSTHEQPGDGQEWQVCVLCGDEKLVQVMEPMGAHWAIQSATIVPSVLKQESMLRLPPPPKFDPERLPEPKSVPPAQAERHIQESAPIPLFPGLEIAGANGVATPVGWDRFVEPYVEGALDLPTDHHIGVETPSGLVASIDPDLVGTPEGEQLLEVLDRVGEAVAEQFSQSEELVDIPGDEPLTEPLLYSMQASETDQELIDELSEQHMEQAAQIVALREKLHTMEQRATEILEADQAGWKAIIAEKDRRIGELEWQLMQAEKVIYVGWGIARGIAESARNAASELERYGR